MPSGPRFSTGWFFGALVWKNRPLFFLVNVKVGDVKDCKCMSKS